MKRLAVIAAAILIFAAGVMLPAHSVLAENEGDSDSGRKEITIEVVEDIPAGDIEDEEVPLAALPVSDKSNAVRHISMMLALLAGACAYSAYFIGYEKKLVRLREEAAEAEVRAEGRL
ncbi:MAG: hypothetical protein IKG25_03290 [Mogibacterium sp.]|nr:hypothetical protein [Mogibacterium sp.]